MYDSLLPQTVYDSILIKNKLYASLVDYIKLNTKNVLNVNYIVGVKIADYIIHTVPLSESPKSRASAAYN